jgi:hypothetical protein
LELTGFLTVLSETLEREIGVQLMEGEFRLGTLDLKDVTELQPLNQRFEVLLLCCPKCKKSTAFLSLGTIDKYLDVEKNSVAQCRHCQYQLKVPKVAQIRAQQDREFDFLTIEEWKPTRILSKKGLITEISLPSRKLKFEYQDPPEKKTIAIEVPPAKLKLIRNLPLHRSHRLRIQVLTARKLDPRSVIRKGGVKAPSSVVPTFKYKLLSLTK